MTERRMPTVAMSQELIDEIDDRLEYGDSRAQWIRGAIRQRLERERTGSDDNDNTQNARAD